MKKILLLFIIASSQTIYSIESWNFGDYATPTGLTTDVVPLVSNYIQFYANETIFLHASTEINHPNSILFNPGNYIANLNFSGTNMAYMTVSVRFYRVSSSGVIQEFSLDDTQDGAEGDMVFTVNKTWSAGNISDRLVMECALHNNHTESLQIGLRWGTDYSWVETPIVENNTGRRIFNID